MDLSLRTLKLVEEWKREAAFEEHSYFFKTPIVDRIRSGSRCFVVGRKGSGKTAISRHIYFSNGRDEHAEFVSLKDFPTDKSFQNNDESFTPENAMKSFWIYAIYTEVLRMMLRNPRTCYDAKKALGELFGNEHISAFHQRVEQVFSPEFSASFWGIELSANSNKTAVRRELSYTDRIRIAEKFIERNLVDDKHFLLFDYLDEEYVDILARRSDSKYISVIRGLLKAVEYVKEFSSRISGQILPVVFLREDIFGIVKDNNRTKWRDYYVHINWSQAQIQKMLAHRISVDAGQEMDFDDAWSLITLPEKIAVGIRQDTHVSVFSFLARRTHMRPRDFIEYIRLCAARVVSSSPPTLIKPSTWKDEEEEYSCALRSEIEDELWGAFPNVEELFECLQHMKKRRFWLEDFEAIAEELRLADSGFPPAEETLKILFSVGVVGSRVRRRNQTGSNFLFHYERQRGSLYTHDQMQIHPGLYKSLSLDY